MPFYYGPVGHILANAEVLGKSLNPKFLLRGIVLILWRKLLYLRE